MHSGDAAVHAAAALALAGPGGADEGSGHRRWPASWASSGLMNVQFAIQGKTIYVLEVNPRASRTVPFISKATGVPLAKIAALCMVGKTLRGAGPHARSSEFKHVAVKESVFPFARFPGVDVILGPGDEVHRRGDGHRRRLRRRPSPRASSPPGVKLPQRGHGVHLGEGRRQAGDGGPGAAARARWASRSSPPRGTHRLPAEQGRRDRAGAEGHRGPAAHRRQDRRRRDSTW